jgi:hypothetical protein
LILAQQAVYLLRRCARTLQRLGACQDFVLTEFTSAARLSARAALDNPYAERVIVYLEDILNLLLGVVLRVVKTLTRLAVHELLVGNLYGAGPIQKLVTSHRLLTLEFAGNDSSVSVAPLTTEH